MPIHHEPERCTNMVYKYNMDGHLLLYAAVAAGCLVVLLLAGAGSQSGAKGHREGIVDVGP